MKSLQHQFAANQRWGNEATLETCWQGHEYTPENTAIYADGARRCRACAKLRHKTQYAPRCAVSFPNCAECGGLFTARRGMRDEPQGCSPKCRREMAKKRSLAWQKAFKQEHGRSQRGGLVESQCFRCETTFTGRKNGRYCSRDCWQSVVSEHYVTEGLHRTKHRRRKQRLREAHVENVSRIAVLDRDKWVCHLCCKKIRKTLRYPHQMSASLDHVIPISAGGSHEMANVRAAHLICNVRKRDRGGNEQLLLIG